VLVKGFFATQYQGSLQACAAAAQVCSHSKKDTRFPLRLCEPCLGSKASKHHFNDSSGTSSYGAWSKKLKEAPTRSLAVANK